MELFYQQKSLLYLQVSEYRMFLNAREEDPHGVGSVVQEGNSCSVQIAGQLVDVGLELCKSYEMKEIQETVSYWHTYVSILVAKT